MKYTLEQFKRKINWFIAKVFVVCLVATTIGAFLGSYLRKETRCINMYHYVDTWGMVTNDANYDGPDGGCICWDDEEE